MSFNHSAASGSAALGIRLGRWIAPLRFSCWTIGTRISVLVLALLVPVNLVVFATILHLAKSASEAQRTSLMYAARSVAAAVDAKLGEYVALAQVLARSPALLDDNLDAFEAEARRTFLSIDDGWVVVANLEGQQLVNTSRSAGRQLPVRSPVGLAAQKQALDTRSIIVSDVQSGTVSHTWIVTIEVPVFKEGQPFRALSISVKAQSFLRLLSNEQVPQKWIATIIDRQGRVIARVPSHEQRVGQLAAEGWRKVMHHQKGVFEFLSLEGDPIVSAQVATSSSGWLVGIKIQKSEMQAAVWHTVRWAAMFGGGLLVLSLLLAGALSRRITEPIAEIRKKAAFLLTGAAPAIPTGPPEVRDLWSALKRSAIERKLAEGRLAEREAQLSLFVTNAPAAIAMFDRDMRYLALSRRFAEDQGLPVDLDLIGRSHYDVFPDLPKKWLDSNARVLAGEELAHEEDAFPRADGRVDWVRWSMKPWRTSDGKIGGALLVTEVITKQVEARRALHESEQRFRATFENAAVGIAHVDPDGAVLLVNQRLCQILGYSVEELLTKRFQDLTHPDHLEANLAQVQRMLNGDINSFRTEKRYFCKDGSIIWARLTVGGVRNKDGTLRYFISVVEDISEIKRADQALRESEERFRGIYEHAGTGIAIADMQGRFQSCNPAYTAMLGYSEDELRRIDFSRLIHPEDRGENLEQVRRLTAREISSFELTNRYIGKDNKIIWVHKRISLIPETQGSAGHFFALVTDITERKRHEEQIREREERLRLALDGAQLGTWRWDVSKGTDAFECDARCRVLLGLPVDTPVSKENLAKAIFTEDRAKLKTALMRAVDPADPRDDYAFEYRVEHLDGTVLWLLSISRAYFEPDAASRWGRRAVFVTGILRDITEERLARAARESEERLRHLGDSLPDNAVYRYAHEADGPTRFHYISAGIEQLNGVHVEDVLRDACVLLGQILPDYVPKLREAELRSASEMTDFKMDLPMRRADGEVRWMRLQSRPHRGQNGTVIWEGVQTDITEHKRAVEALRQSEERFRSIFEHAGTGIVIADLEGRLQSNNPAFSEMLGYSTEELRGLSVSELVHPEDRGANLLSCRRLLAQEIPSIEIMNRAIAKDGTSRWLHKHITLLCDAAGKPFSTLALVTDMTERKRTEMALRESEERFRGIYENAGTGIAIMDLDGRFWTCNPAFSAMLGYTEGELRELTFPEIIHPEDRDSNTAQCGRLLAGEMRSTEIVNRYLTKKGQPIWVYKYVSLLQNPAGAPASMIALVTDITERKQQEDRIHFLMREVNHRSKNLLSVILAVARETVAATPEDFIERFSNRVESLVTNQDLLVKNAWKGADLHDLVRSQLAHFEDLIGTRIDLNGPSLFVTAQAAQAIGMALHELATNAGKYGALTNDGGRVAIHWSAEWSEGGTQTFQMSWRESSGPPVVPPSTRGFGSSVLCKMAELSLGGKAELDFAATGLCWRLECQSSEILEIDSPTTAGDHGKPVTPKVAAAACPRVLIVEDEAIVALEITSMLLKAGFEAVGPARSVNQALRLIDERGCDAGVLDINLGHESSEPVAARLTARGTSFVTVSGYSLEQQPSIFNGSAALVKPLNPEALIAELRKCVAADTGGAAAAAE
jgi:PAS domain S-box-containing protein